VNTNTQNLTQNFNYMQIAIVMKSQTNGCLSPYQYTDNCHQCDKIFTCKIKSDFHVNGLHKKEQFEIDKIMASEKERLQKLKTDVLNTLTAISK